VSYYKKVIRPWNLKLPRWWWGLLINYW